VQLPPMLLLPLTENAVKHGPDAGHRGVITLEVRAAGAGAVAIAVGNPGRFAGRRAGGTGIEMVERRLALAYDGRAMLTIAADGHGERTIAEVTLPAAAPLGQGAT